MLLSMEEAIQAFPDHLLQGKNLAEDFEFPQMHGNKIIVLGMGGSAIAGDFVKSVAKLESPIPVHVIRGGDFPENYRFIDENTIVLAVSYSGNTLETLADLEFCLKRKIKKIIVLSTGGKLKEIALTEKIPFLEIPSGLMPRAAFPFMFVFLLAILQKLSVLEDHTKELEESISWLEKLREKPELAQVLAQKLKGRLPVIYAENALLFPAANRFKCQINENAKQPAYTGIFPEVVHNEIVGFTKVLPLHQFFFAVFLRGSFFNTNVYSQKRIDYTQRLILNTGGTFEEVYASGASLISNLLFLAYFGDWVSLYLAKENGVDADSIQVIENLKEELMKNHANP